MQTALLVEILMLKLICVIMQQNATGTDISKLEAKSDLVDKLDIYKLKNTPKNSRNLKCKVDKLDIDK